MATRRDLNTVPPDLQRLRRYVQRNVHEAISMWMSEVADPETISNSDYSRITTAVSKCCDLVEADLVTIVR